MVRKYALRCLMLTQAGLRMDVLDGGPVEGFVGFFDVQFRGSPENPADFDVRFYHCYYNIATWGCMYRHKVSLACDRLLYG